MKRAVFFLIMINILSYTYSLDTFFCIDGPLRIRSEPNTTSAQIGSLNLFDKADVLERTKDDVSINGISDYWYKIRMGKTEGYVFGGYGIILKEIYEVKTIEDFVKIIPEKAILIPDGRTIYISSLENDVPIISIGYGIKLNSLYFNYSIYFRFKNRIFSNEVLKKLDLEINDTKTAPANRYFGRGSAYDILINTNKSDEFVTNYGYKGRYFFSDWAGAMGYMRDIGCFLFETEFDKVFNGIIIEGMNMWTNYSDDSINKISNEFIKEARDKKILESVLYQILYEIVLRMKIVQ